MILKIESIGDTCKISNSKGIYITGKHGVQLFLQIFFNPSHSMALKHEGGTMCRQHTSKNIEFNCFRKLLSTPTFNHSIACKNKSGPLGRTKNNGCIQKKLALLNKELGALVTQCHPKMCFTSNYNSRCCRDWFAKIIEVKKCMFPNIKTYLSYL